MEPADALSTYRASKIGVDRSNATHYSFQPRDESRRDPAALAIETFIRVDFTRSHDRAVRRATDCQLRARGNSRLHPTRSGCSRDFGEQHESDALFFLGSATPTARPRSSSAGPDRPRPKRRRRATTCHPRAAKRTGPNPLKAVENRRHAACSAART